MYELIGRRQRDKRRDVEKIEREGEKEGERRRERGIGKDGEQM